MRIVTELIIALFSFLAAYVLSLYSLYIPSGLVIIAAALFLSCRTYFVSRRLCDPRLLVTFFWLSGVGLSAMKLSYLAVPWTLSSWISFYLFYALFTAGYEWGRAKAPSEAPVRRPLAGADGLLSYAVIIIIISTIALIAEAFIVGYLPLFTSDTPHAYSYFHVSGLHYLTVSFVLVPAIIVLYLSERGPYRLLSAGQRGVIVLLLMLSLIYPLLMVSRFQFIFETALSVFAYLLSFGGRMHRSPGKLLPPLLAGAAAIILIYVFISVERAHSAEYLLGIFDMKYDLPVWLAQPYIYIANNFDNFNALTLGLTAHAHGLRELFPFFALTGLKFVFPSLTDFPLYVTREELTTLTLIYDAYYDFGILGVALFSLVLGVVSAYVLGSARSPAPIRALLGAQLCFYLAFSFFTTWFSNASSWFYLALTFLLWIYLWFYDKMVER